MLAHLGVESYSEASPLAAIVDMVLVASVGLQFCSSHSAFSIPRYTSESTFLASSIATTTEYYAIKIFSNLQSTILFLCYQTRHHLTIQK